MKPFGWLTNAKRMREIIAVLWRNGYDGFLQKIQPPAGWLRKIAPKPKTRHNQWERIRIVLEELGPTFVKFGQILSMRPDALPEPLIVELQKLQANVTTLPFEEMKPVIEDGLNGGDMHTIFSEFNHVPLAAASMAQVYTAILRSSGQPVVVKVQRPGIDKKIDSDFQILKWLANKAQERVEDLRAYDIPSIVAELERGLDQELDFRIEVRNTTCFLQNNPTPDQVTAPRVYPEFSSETVIVMDLVEGLRTKDLKPGSELAKTIASRGAASLFHQILVDGFFHADPHSGNILIQRDARICFLDWGLVGQLTRRMRYTLVDLFQAFLSGDPGRVVSVALDLDRTTSIFPDTRAMERDIMFALRDTYDPATGKGKMGRAMLQLLHIFGENGIEVAQDYALVAKAVYSIEETGNALDPDFSLVGTFEPAVKKLLKERHDPSEMIKNFTRSFFTGMSRIQDLPAEIQRVMRLLESGRTTINFQHKGLENIDDVLNSASNRLTLGLVIAAMIIGSSIVVATKIPPLVGDNVSVFGVVGYVISAMMGLWIVFDILRHGRHR